MQKPEPQSPQNPQFAGSSKTQGNKAVVKDTANVGTKEDLRQGSDPIFGSLGPDGVDKPKPTTDAEKLEADLASRKPVNFDLDPEEHPDTQASIAWAEKQFGSKLPTPTKGDGQWHENDNNNFVTNYDYEDDADVVSTLDSAKQAEQIYGYNQYQNWNYNYTNSGSSGNSWWQPNGANLNKNNSSWGYGY